MKALLESFKEFLKEDLFSYIHNSEVTLYHYAPIDAESLVLDPAYFGSSPHSRREKESSTIPRILFYLNPSQREHYVAQTRTLYRVNVPSSSIYNILIDPEGLIQQVRHPLYGLRSGIELDDLMNAVKEDFPGLFYVAGGMDLVAWFEPIEAVKISEEERSQLEV